MGLSLPAEVLLLSVDPADGGLLAKRGRLRKAVRAAGQVEGSPGSLRRARRELLDAGLVEVHGPTRRLTLSERTGPARRFHALKRGAAQNEWAGDRDQQLFVLLAGSGALARRLNRSERRIARRRLSSLIPKPNASTAEMVPGLTALALLGGLGFGELAGGADSGTGESGSGGDGGGFDASVGGGGEGH